MASDEVTKMRQQRERATAGVGADGVRRYIETDDRGGAWITTAAADASGRPNPPVTAENIRRHLPETADALRAQGAARRPATAGDAAAAASAERARIQSILDLDHAAGREALARELALTADMTVERAASILQAAPAERPGWAGVLAPDPGEEARSVAESATSAARRGGYIR